MEEEICELWKSNINETKENLIDIELEDEDEKQISVRPRLFQKGKTIRIKPFHFENDVILKSKQD